MVIIIWNMNGMYGVSCKLSDQKFHESVDIFKLKSNWTTTHRHTQTLRNIFMCVCRVYNIKSTKFLRDLNVKPLFGCLNTINEQIVSLFFFLHSIHIGRNVTGEPNCCSPSAFTFIWSNYPYEFGENKIYLIVDDQQEK